MAIVSKLEFKRSQSILKVLGLALVCVSAAACSTASEDATGKDLSTSGPTIVNARPNPEEFDLDSDLNPVSRAEVLADVKDFSSQVSEVKLRFVHVPLEVPMTHMGGTTWRAELNPEQLRALAVSGQNMRYEANIIAKNEDGDVAVSPDPIEVAVNAEEAARPTG